MNKFLFLFFIVIIPLSIVAFIFREDISANIKDRLNIRPKQYFGVTVDMSQILPESQNYIKNSNGEDLIDISQKLGINMFRLTNIASITKAHAVSAYSHEQWAQVLNKMRKKGIYAIILVEANSEDTKFHNQTLDQYYIDFVKNYIVTPDVCNFSNVFAIDIRNEPLLNKENIMMLTQASNLVKSACPQTKITIGSWHTASGKKDASGEPEYNWHDPKEVLTINSIVDIHSVHIYGFDKPKKGPYPDPYLLTVGYLKEIKKYTTKPIFIEEFGAGNGQGLTDQNTIGSPELQKSTYESVLKASFDYKNKGVLGATGYLFVPRNGAPDTWSITKDNANILLPAAFTFKQYAN